MQLTGLNVHPVKSTAVRAVRSARVLRRGLEDDHSWMVVDGDGVMVSVREARDLLRIVSDTPAIEPALGRALRLRAAGHDDLLLDEPTGPRVPVRLFRHHLEAVPAGAEADAWVRRVVGHDDLRLVWCDDPTRRQVNPAHSEPGDHTAFADGYPVTVASEASLRQLQDWVVETALERGEEPPEPLSMTRFRPNLVVDGEEPFAEDRWTALEVGSGAGAVRLRVARPVDRCVITTVDPETLERGQEPLRTLARHRRPVDVTLFAVHLVPETTGTISVGDPVRAFTDSSL